jgi:hypothetical protein
LNTVKGQHRYPPNSIVKNKRTGQIEWNPFSPDPYRIDHKVNLLKNAANKLAGSTVWPNQLSVLPRSSVMGVENEYSNEYLDKILAHCKYIPLVGEELQGWLDHFDCTYASKNLLDLVQTPLVRLKEDFASRHLFEISKLYSHGENSESTHIIAILRDRYYQIEKIGKNTGYATLHDLVQRLLARLAEIIPWDKPWEERLRFRDAERKPSLPPASTFAPSKGKPSKGKASKGKKPTSKGKGRGKNKNQFGSRKWDATGN